MAIIPTTYGGRRSPRMAAVWVPLLIVSVAGLTGCATRKHLGSGGLHDVSATAPATVDPSSSPTDPATPTASADPTSSPSTAPIAVGVKVTAVDDSYTGLCRPPTTATSFKAVIKVSHGPATVHYRWTTGNGGDSDPSIRTVTFPGSGPASKTVYHNESFYPPAPYPASTQDWAAVKLIDFGGATSNHASFTINCVPFTVHISGVVTRYDGACPPPHSGPTAITLSGVISVTTATSVTFHWRSGNGGDSDPSPDTVMVLPGSPYTFHHYEWFYPPAPYPTTSSDWIAVEASTDGYSTQSNHVPIKITCEPWY